MTIAVIIQKVEAGTITNQQELNAAIQNLPANEKSLMSEEVGVLYGLSKNLPWGPAEEIAKSADTTSVFTKLLTQKAEEKLAKGEARDLADAYAQADRENPKLYPAHCHSVRYPS